jgi:hypothetical protein
LRKIEALPAEPAFFPKAALVQIILKKYLHFNVTGSFSIIFFKRCIREGPTVMPVGGCVHPGLFNRQCAGRNLTSKTYIRQQ